MRQVEMCDSFLFNYMIVRLNPKENIEDYNLAEQYQNFEINIYL